MAEKNRYHSESFSIVDPLKVNMENPQSAAIYVEANALQKQLNAMYLVVAVGGMGGVLRTFGAASS